LNKVVQPGILFGLKWNFAMHKIDLNVRNTVAGCVLVTAERTLASSVTTSQHLAVLNRVMIPTDHATWATNSETQAVLNDKNR
jgi:hypothetical protein